MYASVGWNRHEKRNHHGTENDLSKYSLSAVGKIDNLSPTHHLNQMEDGYATGFLSGFTGMHSTHEHAPPLGPSSSSTTAGGNDSSAGAGTASGGPYYPGPFYLHDYDQDRQRHDVAHLEHLFAVPQQTVASNLATRQSLDVGRPHSLNSMDAASSIGSSPPTTTTTAYSTANNATTAATLTIMLDSLAAAIDGRQDQPKISRGRGRYPTPTHIMVPTQDGTPVSLDQAVDFLVDATLPLTPQHIGGGGGGGGSGRGHGCGSGSGPSWDGNTNTNTTTTNTTTTDTTKRRKTDAERAYSKTEEFKRLKNSDAAKRSRLRKVLRLDLMESAVKNLEARNAEYKEENDRLKDENRRLLLRLTMEKFGDDDDVFRGRE